MSTTKVPFVPPARFEEDLSPDRSILEVIVDMEITEDQFRSSLKLKEVINEIVSSISLFHCWGKQSIKVRLQAFVKLLVCQLCVPHIMTLYGVGTSLFGGNKGDSANDLVMRGKRILIEAFTLFKRAEEAILDSGDDVCLDKRRFDLFILLMEFKCSSLLSDGLTVREHAGSALEALSCHILSVTAVTHCIHDSIRLVTSRLTNTLMTETANSTIEQSRTQLEVIVLDYFAWLRGNAEQLTKMCRREEILTAVDPSTRAWLKAETYGSPIEILSIYSQKYRGRLTHIPIPLQPYRNTDLEQARKDLQRETVLLNNILYTGGVSALSASTDCGKGGLTPQPLHAAIRSELRKVLAYLFEIDAFQGAEDPRGDDLDGTDQESSNSNSWSFASSTSSAGVMELKLAARRTPKCAIRKTLDSPRASRSNTLDSGSLQHSQEGTVTTSGSSGSRPGPDSSGSMTPTYWEYELLDALYSYTALAASRTFAAGDAFLILNDLYGGEGLTFCPSSGPRYHGTATGGTSSSVHSPAAVTRGVVSPTAASPQPQKAKPEVDATIAVLASGVKVTLRERYNLFVSEEMARCVDTSKLRPLMRFECTTTTLLILDTEQTQGETDAHSLRMKTLEEKRAACGHLFQTIISNPEHICHRAVTIEPFL